MMFFSSKRETVLVVAAHPDDEVLGCGATMAKHVKRGDAVHVLILAEGLTSRADTRDEGRKSPELVHLHNAAVKANKILGARSIYLNSFPDNRMDSVDLLDVVKVVESFVKKYQPSRIYTHHSGDVNVDHRIANEAVTTACRPQPGHCVESILFFEVMSSTHWQTSTERAFNPQVHVDISDTLRLKRKALEAYGTEMRPWPHARSYEAIEHLAKFRGSVVGVEAAESFAVGRILSR